MSDDAEQYFSAWVDVFACTPKKLLCSYWAWRKNILEKVKDVGIRSKILNSLLEMSTHQDTAIVHTMIANFLECCALNPKTIIFGKYFETMYSKCIEQWTISFRQGAYIKTNMLLESFH